MLEGIEILAQSEIMQCASWVLIVIASGFTLLIIGSIFIAISKSILDDDVFATSGGIMIILGGVTLIVSILLSDTFQEPTGRYKYQVLIGENVSFTDIYSNYEVVDQNGKIWTIREKQ